MGPLPPRRDQGNAIDARLYGLTDDSSLLLNGCQEATDNRTEIIFLSRSSGNS